MPTIIEPPVPPTSAAQEPPNARVHFRVQQIGICVLALGATAWLWSIHALAGIVAAIIAKHVLVAVLAAGLNYPAVESPKSDK
ncbi:MAG: hypothetical protein WCL32_07185 [Planctomycetota bacterium]|jgi:hypothetical protein